MDEQQHSRATFGRFVLRTVTATAIVLTAIALIALVVITIRVWFVLFMGVLLAVFLRTQSLWLERRLKMRAPWSLVLVLFVLGSLLAVSCWLLAGPIVEQFYELKRRLPEAIQQVRGHLDNSWVKDYLPNGKPTEAEKVDVGKTVAPTVANIFKITFAVIAGALVALFIGLYMAFDPVTYRRGLIRLIPLRKRLRVSEVLDELELTMGRWILGQLVSMFCVGVLIALGLYVSGVPLWLALGVIAGVLDFIPVLGPIIAAVPAVLLGFTVSPWHALYAVAVFVAANQIEEHVLVPLIHRYSVWLPPALTLFALTIMTAMFGLLGALLATPLAAMVLVLVKRLYVEDVLGDKVDSS